MGKKGRKAKSKRKVGGTSDRGGGGPAAAAAAKDDLEHLLSSVGGTPRTTNDKYSRYKSKTRSFRDFLRRAVSNSRAASKSSAEPAVPSSSASDGERPAAGAGEDDLYVERIADLSRAADLIYDAACETLRVDASDLETEVAGTPTASPAAVAAVPRSVLRDLDETIALREELSKGYERQAKADEGHRFMIDTLKHCRKKLGWVSRIAKFQRTQNRRTVQDNVASPALDDGAGDVTSLMGRFAPFLEEDDDDEGEEGIDDGMIESGLLPQVERPKETEDQKKLSIEEDLIKGTDRFRAWHFLMSLDSFMGSIDSHYTLLKNAMRGEGEIGAIHANDSRMKLLCECTVPVSLGINCVRSMEEDLAADFEHLSSFYNVLAVVYLIEYIASIEAKVQRKIIGENPTLVKKFAGEILESVFHNAGAPKKLETIKSRFIKASKLTRDVVEQSAREIHLVCSMENQLLMEEGLNADLLSVVKQTTGNEPHSWLKKTHHYTGGNRCILNTHKLTQMVFDINYGMKKLIPKGNYFGPLWDERSCPARRIRGDMDELLAGDILPELLAKAKGKGFDKIPAGQDLLPLMYLLNRQMHDPNNVPVSLSFGLHAILTAIFVMQGDGDIKKLSFDAKVSWSTLFEQLQEQVGENLKAEQSPYPPDFYLLVGMYTSLSELPKPVGKPGRTSSEDNAFWNPVQAGTFLLFATQACSIGLGSQTVDTIGQLRLTLHMFNALNARGLFDGGCSEDISFLTTLNDTFKNTRSLWVGGCRSKQGDFMKGLLKAWGHSTQKAICMYEERLHIIGDRDASRTRLPSMSGNERSTMRDLDPYHPGQYSVSFRRLVLHDMTGANADYSVINKPVGGKKKLDQARSAFLDFVTNVNMIRDGIDDDEAILPLNFTCVGNILNQFICDLSEHMGWNDIIRPLICDEFRQGRRMDGSQMRDFDKTDAALERQAVVLIIANMLADLDVATDDALSNGDASRAGKFMTEYFKGAAKNCTFVIKSNSPNPSDDAPSISSPLDGAHPYGRTGRTVDDPLQAFFHLKFTRAGTPAARLIKPGKLTPYISDGESTCSPYEETGTGKNLPRRPNGKRRHIASYSPDELVALGWDGAKYSSNNKQLKLEGCWVPFVCGYDSDPDDQYEAVDIRVGKKVGTIGLAPGEVGLYMKLPNQGIVQLNSGH